MAGGLLNLVAVGNQNIFLTGNPKKTFFKFVYAKYSNFGLQRFRLDYEGTRNLNLSERTQFTFKVKRYADLLMDTYLVVKMPHIWSPIFFNKNAKPHCQYIPYEFKWICDLGTQMIEEITVSCGGETLQKMSGEYLTALVKRDFSNTKRDLHDKMSGNTARWNDPANYGNNGGNYPNAIYSDTPGGAEPSIRGGNLYIPINFWFTLSSKMAFPLVALQYNELEIHISLRPVRELFTIRDVSDESGLYHSIIQPNFNKPEQQMYTFLQTPPNNILSDTNDVSNLIYTDKRTDWNADVHLIATYGFLSDDERRIFAAQPQNYLVKEIYEYKFFNVSETVKVKLESLGMVASWMFFLRRSDANLRNEWSNYTNWPYKKNPLLLSPVKIKYVPDELCFSSEPVSHILFNGNITGQYESYYEKNILINMAILLDGKYRENMLEEGVYNSIEKYVRTSGNAPDGLYVYNFCIQTDCFQLQPSGAINLSKFRNIEFEMNTFTPARDTDVQFFQICDPSTATVVGVNKPMWQLFEYTYDLHVFEERYNMVKFESGNCGLMYAR